MAEWYHQEIVRKIFETTPDMLGLLDENGKILVCNHHVEYKTGYCKEELIGIVGPVELIDEVDRERAMREFAKVKTDGINLNVQLLMKRKDGSVFPSIWSGSILRDESNNIVGYLVTGKDLSEIHELRDRLSRTEQRLSREKLAVIGELTARIAHDLRNPLHVVINTIILIKVKKPEIVSELGPEFERLGRSVDRMAHQIDGVLDYVRPIVLKPAIESLMAILESTLERIRVPADVEIRMPERDYDLLCDTEKMEIVFANLITNAIQAMGGAGIVRITAYDKDGWVVIEVGDTGRGIPDSVVGRIFEPLVTTKQTGTGLGLVSSKNIVENHGGSISLKETGPRGTTFLIRLPKTNLVHQVG